MDYPFLVVPDFGQNVLQDQQFFPTNMPGGFGSGSSDPSGGNGSNPGGINPNPTGGWQDTALGIARLALAAFVVHEQGSPAASTPPRRIPGTVITAPGTIGGISTGTITTALFVIAGGILLFVLVKKAG